jgi:hypothetical protein
MKKAIYIIGSLVALSLIGFGVYKYTTGGKPVLVKYDALTGIATYKDGGKTSTLNTGSGGTIKLGEYLIEPIKLTVNVAGKNIGDVVGVKITKNGLTIQEIRA